MTPFETSICVAPRLTGRTRIARHAGLVGTVGLLLIAAILAFALASCGTHRKLAPAAPPQSEPIGLDTPPPAPRDKEFVRVNSDNPAENGPSRRLDSIVVAPHRSLLDKVFGRKPKPYVADNHVGNIGKKSTVSIYYGPATVSTTTVGKKATAATAEGATATAIGKAKGPTAIGDSATAQDFTKQGQRGGAAASGAGATATATTIKPPTPWLKYGLWALGAVGGYWLLFGGGGAVLLALWRRNKSTSNQA